MGRQSRWCLLFLGAFVTGCAHPPYLPSAPQMDKAPSSEIGPIRQVSYEQKQDAASEPPLHAPTAVRAAESPREAVSPFADKQELSVDALVEAVLARNPSLPEMVAAWRAVQARYPQVTSLDDPLFGTTLAPQLGASGGNGYRFELFQRYPWPGKLRLRGQVVLGEASAAGRDVEDIRQQLIELARDAFYDYYLSYRTLEVNTEAIRLMQRFKRDAEERYKTGGGSAQDPLQAEVELGRLRERDFALQRQRQVAIARINALLQLPPFLPLPPPPKELKVEGELPDLRELVEQALSQRLDLLKLADQIKAAEAAVQLAYKEYYPDFDTWAAYDRFWTLGLQQPQVGVRVNLPVRLAKRRGAVVEAESRLAELRAQYARQTNQVGFEVQQAYEQWRESLRTVQLLEKEVLPASRLNVKAAEPAYLNGRIPLTTLIEAQRNLVDLQDRYYQATAAFFQRRTALQRSLTGTPATIPIPTPAQRPSPGQPGYPLGLGGGGE